MSSGLSFNAANFYRTFNNTPNYRHSSNVQLSNEPVTGFVPELITPDMKDLLLNTLSAMATQNGFNDWNVTKTRFSSGHGTNKVAEMLKAGKKQEVKDKMGASAVPALLSIVKDTSQPMQVRIDAIATLAKLVDEGKAPASCLVSLLKDPNCKSMAERAMANVGKEIMPEVKRLLKSGDPVLRESAKNILNDMKDAWAGYENDPKWGQECRELLPEVDKLLNEVKEKEESSNFQVNNSDNPDNQANSAGYNRQYINLSPLVMT